MTTHGITINLDAIAKGMMEEVIPEDEKFCMAYGMLPAKWMELAEIVLRTKITHAAYPTAKGEELKIFNRAIKPEIINTIMQGLSAALLKEAKAAGICNV